MRATRPAAPRPEFRFTREGRVFVAVTLGVGIGAVNTGNNLLYLVLGLMLGLMLTSGVLSEIVLRGTHLRRMPPPRLFAGRRALFELEVRNDKRFFASTSFEVLDVAEGEGDGASAYLLKLPPRSRERVVIERIPMRRGTMRSTHLRVRTRFPFGILEKTRSFRVESEVVVFPELVEVALPDTRRSLRGHERPRARGGQGSEVIGLREHRPMDSMREIHWRRTAALGRPVTRERAAEADELLRLALPASAADEAVFERRISELASLAVLAVETGRPVELHGEHGLMARAADQAALDRMLHLLAFATPATALGPRGAR